MTASTRWLLARIVPLLGIAGLMLCLDGAVVLILAYEEEGGKQSGVAATAAVRSRTGHHGSSALP